MTESGTFYERSKTATADTAFQVDDDLRLVLSSINLQCTTNDLYYGDRANQRGIIRANAVVWFDKPVRLADIWFKNFTAGSNGVITVTGTIERS